MKKKLLALGFALLYISASASAQVGEVSFSRSAKTADGASEFKSSEFIFAHVKFSQPLDSLLTLNDRPVTLLTEYYSKGKLLEEEMFGFEPAKVKSAKQSTIVLPVISEPAGDVPAFGKNLFAIRLPAALAKLPEGTHEIEFRMKSYNYKDAAEAMSTGKFMLIVEAGARAWYQKNEKEAYDAFTKRGVTTVIASERDLAMGVIGGTAVITLFNNCGTSVWLRKALGSDKREYRLAPGQEMKYDRNSGGLEEWNFKTLRWGALNRVWEPDASGKAKICK